MILVILLQIPFYPPQQAIEDFSPKVSSIHNRWFVPFSFNDICHNMWDTISVLKLKLGFCKEVYNILWYTFKLTCIALVMHVDLIKCN